VFGQKSFSNGRRRKGLEQLRLAEFAKAVSKRQIANLLLIGDGEDNIYGFQNQSTIEI